MGQRRIVSMRQHVRAHNLRQGSSARSGATLTRRPCCLPRGRPCSRRKRKEALDSSLSRARPSRGQRLRGRARTVRSQRAADPAVASRVRSRHHDPRASANRFSARLASGVAARADVGAALPRVARDSSSRDEDARRPANTRRWPLFLRHDAVPGRYPVTGMRLTDRLTAGVRTALAKAGLPEPDTCVWEVPRQAEHGDYATNAPMVLARTAKRAPRQIADLVVKHFPPMPEVERIEVAGPGFLNVFLAPAWCAGALAEILGTGVAYGRGESQTGRRIRLEFVSANPTGPLVIANARAEAVGDALASLLRSQGASVTTEFYINDAGNQFDALARSFEARVKQEFGLPAALPENGYPGEYLVDLAKTYRAEGGGLMEGAPERLEHFGRYAVRRMVEGQRKILRDYGVEFDVWSSEYHDVRTKGLPERMLAELATRGLSYEQDGALWFRSSASEEAGDDKDRVL